MTYYPTLDEDLARAKEILEKGKAESVSDDLAKEMGPGLHARLTDLAGGTIFGADTYAAYKLLESFVATIEEVTQQLATSQAVVADFTHSFELYHTASMALMHAYKGAHPEVPEDVWPDATKVNVWAAEQLEQLEQLERESDEAEKGWGECVQLNARLFLELELASQENGRERDAMVQQTLALQGRAEQAEAAVATLREENLHLKAEHTRAILRYTAKGYAAGENTDAKHWRERAEAAEADLAKKNAALTEIADLTPVSEDALLNRFTDVVLIARSALGWDA